MAIFNFADAKAHLKQRIGNRTDVTDADLGKYINQAQYLIATNVIGLDTFDATSPDLTVQAGNTGYPITPLPPTGFGLGNFWALSVLLDVTDANAYRRLWRGEWDLDLSLAQKPTSPPTLWFHRLGVIVFNTHLDKERTLRLHYRRIPALDTLEVPDDFFEPLIQLAMTFCYPTIGRLRDRDMLYSKLPSALQLSMVNPLTPAQFEAMADSNLAVYVER